MRLRCPNCRSFLCAPEVNPRQQAARCRACETIFGKNTEPRLRRRRRPMYAPSGVEVVVADTGAASGYRERAGDGELEVRAVEDEPSQMAAAKSFALLVFAVPFAVASWFAALHPFGVAELACWIAAMLAPLIILLGGALSSAVAKLRRWRTATRVRVVGDRLLIESTWLRRWRREIAVADLRRPATEVKRGRTRWRIDPGKRVYDLLVGRVGDDRAYYLEWLVEQFLSAREEGEPFRGLVGASDKPGAPVRTRVSEVPPDAEAEAEEETPAPAKKPRRSARRR